jgi:hypothetical protein
MTNDPDDRIPGWFVLALVALAALVWIGYYVVMRSLL